MLNSCFGWLRVAIIVNMWFVIDLLLKIKLRPEINIGVEIRRVMRISWFWELRPSRRCFGDEIWGSNVNKHVAISNGRTGTETPTVIYERPVLIVVTDDSVVRPVKSRIVVGYILSRGVVGAEGQLLVLHIHCETKITCEFRRRIIKCKLRTLLHWIIWNI